MCGVWARAGGGADLSESVEREVRKKDLTSPALLARSFYRCRLDLTDAPLLPPVLAPLLLKSRRGLMKRKAGDPGYQEALALVWGLLQ